MLTLLNPAVRLRTLNLLYMVLHMQFTANSVHSGFNPHPEGRLHKPVYIQDYRFYMNQFTLDQWYSQVIGIGREPALGSLTTLALKRASREIAWHERDEHGALVRHTALDSGLNA